MNIHQQAAKVLFASVLVHMRPASSYYPDDTLVYEFEHFVKYGLSAYPVRNILKQRHSAVQDAILKLEDATPVAIVRQLDQECDAYWSLLQAFNEYAQLDYHKDIGVLNDNVCAIGEYVANALVRILSSK